jgi:hypothetical protein
MLARLQWVAPAGLAVVVSWMIFEITAAATGGIRPGRDLSLRIAGKPPLA